MIGGTRLSDEALDGDQSLGDGIGAEEQALQGDRSQQRGTARRDEARRGHLSSVDDEADLGNRPGLLAAARGLNGLSAQCREFELVGQRAWNDKECSAGVHEQVDGCRPIRGTGETRSDAEQPHEIPILWPLDRKSMSPYGYTRLAPAAGFSMSCGS